MPFVLDASVTANWLMPDEEPRALDAWERIRSDPGVVPAHWWFEVRNILLMAERRARISEPDTRYIIDRLSRLRIVQSALPDEQTVFLVARRHRLTFYDASYLGLALCDKVALATLDEALLAAARAEGVSLVGG